MYQKGRYNFKDFGQAIREAREKKGWTREELAEMVSLTPRTIMYIEGRGQHPSFQKLYELLTLLSISADQFFFPGEDNDKIAKRLQFDALLDELDEKDLVVLEATARGLKSIKESEEK